MLDVKLYLSAAGEDVADTAFLDEHGSPFITFLDRVEGIGSDFRRDLIQHDLTVERYSADGEPNAKLLELLEKLDPGYSSDKQWLPKESCFMEIFDLSFKERR